MAGIVSARICVRRDTTANWRAHPDFVPLRGEVIVYLDRGTARNENGEEMDVPGVKIGDGKAYLIDLPFVGGEEEKALMAQLTRHEQNADIHTSPEEKEKWNQKLNCGVSGEILLLTRD